MLEDGSGVVNLWFSPNTPHARTSKPGKNESAPPDLAEVFDIIANAQQAIIFLAFEPGRPSIVDAIAAAQKAKPSLFVRGAVTAAGAAGDFRTAINGDGDAAMPKRQKGDPPLPEDYRVIHAQGVNAGDAFGSSAALRRLDSMGIAGATLRGRSSIAFAPSQSSCAANPSRTPRGSDLSTPEPAKTG